jgi:hypothetical protein
MISRISGKNNGCLKFPNKPFYLVPTHFIVDKNIKKTIQLINDCLVDIKEVSFELNNENYIWKCVFVHISAYAKFEIRLYSSDEKDKIVVECNCLTGDSLSFYDIYNKIKLAFTMSLSEHLCSKENCRTEKNINANVIGSVMPGMSNYLEEHETLEAFKSFLKMAEQESIYSQQISAYIFCDLTYQYDMESALYTTNTIETMSKLLNFICKKCNHCEIVDNQNFLIRDCICTITKRLVILGISELSNKSKFHTQIVKAPHLLRNLFKFATNGPYYNIHMRRASALIIANCSTKGWANTIVNTIGKESLKIWFHTTACIKDKILKNEIERSKKALKKVMIF